MSLRPLAARSDGSSCRRDTVNAAAFYANRTLKLLLAHGVGVCHTERAIAVRIGAHHRYLLRLALVPTI